MDLRGTLIQSNLLCIIMQKSVSHDKLGFIISALLQADNKVTEEDAED